MARCGAWRTASGSRSWSRAFSWPRGSYRKSTRSRASGASPRRLVDLRHVRAERGDQSGYAFNPHQPVGGATAPLRLPPRPLLRGLPHRRLAREGARGRVCLGASAVLTREAVRRMLPGTKGLPLLAGLLVATSPRSSAGRSRASNSPCTSSSRAWASTFSPAAARPQRVPLLRGRSLAKAGRNPPRLPVTPGSEWGARAQGGRRSSRRGPDRWEPILPSTSRSELPLPTSVAVKAHWSAAWFPREWSMLAQWLWLWGPSRIRAVGAAAPLLLPAIVVGSATAFRRWPLAVLYVFGFPPPSPSLGDRGPARAVHRVRHSLRDLPRMRWDPLDDGARAARPGSAPRGARPRMPHVAGRHRTRSPGSPTDGTSRTSTACTASSRRRRTG